MEHRNFGDCDWLVTWFNLDRDTLKLQSDPIKNQWLVSLYVLLLSHLLLIHCLLFVTHSILQNGVQFKWQVFGMDLIGLLFLLLLWGISLLELLYCSKVGRHVRCEGNIGTLSGHSIEPTLS